MSEKTLTLEERVKFLEAQVVALHAIYVMRFKTNEVQLKQLWSILKERDLVSFGDQIEQGCK